MSEKNFEDFESTSEKPLKETEKQNEKPERLLPETKDNDIEAEEQEKEDKERELRLLKDELEKIISPQENAPTEEKESKEASEKRIKQYQEKYIPPYLKKSREESSWLNKIIGFCALKFKNFEVKKEEKDLLPNKVPFLVLCNHSGGETGPLIGFLSEHNHHITAGTETNWKRSRFRSWLLKKMGMILIKESLANLSEKQKLEVLERVPNRAKKGYLSVIKKEKSGRPPVNVEFVKTVAAFLSRGDVVSLFPEGLFLCDRKKEDRKKLRMAYPGVRILAQEYQKLTGKELPIVPVAIFEDEEKNKIRVGKPIFLDNNQTDLSEIDWCMAHIAQLLPDDQRGYYKEAVDKL